HLFRPLHQWPVTDFVQNKFAEPPAMRTAAFEYDPGLSDHRLRRKDRVARPTRHGAHPAEGTEVEQGGIADHLVFVAANPQYRQRLLDVTEPACVAPGRRKSVVHAAGDRLHARPA